MKKILLIVLYVFIPFMLLASDAPYGALAGKDTDGGRPVIERPVSCVTRGRACVVISLCTVIGGVATGLYYLFLPQPRALACDDTIECDRGVFTCFRDNASTAILDCFGDCYNRSSSASSPYFQLKMPDEPGKKTVPGISVTDDSVVEYDVYSIDPSSKGEGCIKVNNRKICSSAPLSHPLCSFNCHDTKIEIRIVSVAYFSPIVSVVSSDCEVERDYFTRTDFTGVVVDESQLKMVLNAIRTAIEDGDADGKYTCSAGIDGHPLIITQENVKKCTFFRLIPGLVSTAETEE